MPIKDPETRRAYLKKYEEERRLGLRRSGAVGEVLAGMDERRESRAAYLKRWAEENRERRAKQKREARRKARLAAEAGALRRLVGPSCAVPATEGSLRSDGLVGTDTL